MYDPRIRIGIGCLIAVALFSAPPENDAAQASRVENKIFVSPDNPKIRVSVDNKFQYIGDVRFTVDNVAAGSRYVFLRATPGKHVQQMFIIQQEGFLATSSDTYKYSITNPAKLGRFEYRHSADFYDNDAEIRGAPGKEGDITKRFLEALGYTLEPELVMSRFARPADSQHKYEIIFFCYENLSNYGHKLADLPERSSSPAKRAIKEKVDGNCRNAFQVTD